MCDRVFFYAAGLGTRMKPLTDTCPKPLIKVSGRTLLDHSIVQADDAVISDRAINVHYLADQITSHPSVQGMTVFDETKSVLETGGGLKNAVQTLGPEPLFTMNTDAVWSGENPFSALRRVWKPIQMGALMLLVPTANARGHVGPGDFDINPDGTLERGSAYVYTGCQIIDPSGLAEIDETHFSTNLYWDALKQSNRLFGTVYHGHWCDVGRPSSIPIAEAMLSETDHV